MENGESAIFFVMASFVFVCAHDKQWPKSEAKVNFT